MRNLPRTFCPVHPRCATLGFARETSMLTHSPRPSVEDRASAQSIPKTGRQQPWLRRLMQRVLRRLHTRQTAALPPPEALPPPMKTKARGKPAMPTLTPQRPFTGPRPLKKIAIVNHKGGVGKTSTSVHLAGALAEMGYRILLVDCDSQGDLSALFLSGHENLPYTIADVFAGTGIV